MLWLLYLYRAMQKFYFVVFILLVAGCSRKQPGISIQGVYNMTSQSFKGTNIDTADTQQKQLKIYTDSMVMYTHINPADSVGAFGAGYYTIDGNELMEDIVYSAGDTAENVNTFPDTVGIVKSPAGYTQVIATAAQGKDSFHFTQEFASVGNAAASPLDGVWKQVSAYSIVGKDTVHWSDVQYKAFYAGQFAYGEFDKGSGKNISRTYVSWGTFILSGSALTETVTAANTTGLAGKTFNLDIIFRGRNSFTQTTTSGNTKEVIVYERVHR